MCRHASHGLRRGRKSGRLLGVDEDKFPRDFATFARDHPAIRGIPARYPLPGPLAFRQLHRFLAEAPKPYRVDIENLPRRYSDFRMVLELSAIVIAGLDPAIQERRPGPVPCDAWMPGSSPGMTRSAVSKPIRNPL